MQAELEIDGTIIITAYYTPYRKATQVDPEEGGYDDLQVSIFGCTPIEVDVRSDLGKRIVEKLEEERKESDESI